MASVVGLFDTFAQAEHAVQDLVDSGVRRDDISMVASDGGGAYAQAVGEAPQAGEGAATGAIGGGVLGGVLGLLVGIGALAIPGVGPVIAAGPIAAALSSAGVGAAVGAGVGAVGGGLLDVLVSAGIPEEQAHFYAEGVRRGGTLVTVRTGDVADSSVRDILQRNGAVDVGARGAEWRRAGWSRFEPDAGPPTREWQKASADATAEDGGDLPAGGPAATSIGALSGGTIPGGYGPAGDVIFGHDDAGDRRRPD